MPMRHTEVMVKCWKCGGLFCLVCHRVCPYCKLAEETIPEETLEAGDRQEAGRVLVKRSSGVLVGKVV